MLALDSLVIRQTRTEDLEEVLSLLGQSDMSAANVPEKGRALRLFQHIESCPNHELYVAEIDREIVGSFALIIVQHLSNGGACSALLEDVVVRSNWQRRGVGAAMNEFASTRARELGCYKIVLSSGLHRSRAHAFYESQGFKRHGYSYLLSLPRN